MALTLLREAITKSLTITLIDSPTNPADGYLHIDTQCYLPCKFKTSYKTRRGDYYEVDSLWYCYANIHTKQLKYSDYLIQCQQQQIQPVDLSQQRLLLEYLRNERDNTPYIDQQEEQQHQQQVQAFVQQYKSGVRPASLSGSPSAKRQRTDSTTATVTPSAALTTDNWTIDDILADEQIIATRNTILQCSSDKTLNNVLIIYDTTQKQIQQQQQLHAQQKAEAKKLALTKPAGGVKGPTPLKSLSTHSPTGGIPIIIVPAAISSVLTLYNAYYFLVNGIFEPSEDKRRENPKKEPFVTLQRTSYLDKSKEVTWHVIDDIAQLKSPADWNRVCAVFVSGATWQFRGWPADIVGSTPASIFDKVCPFHLYFDDEPINANVKQWRLHRLAISKTKRYQDRSTALEFWDVLGNFVIPRNAEKGLKI